jgi:flagellar M-ring protein FliF
VQKIAAAVLVDDFVEVKDDKGETTENRRKRTPEEMKQIEDLARAAIGIDAARGDVLSVQNVSFLVSPPEKLTSPAVAERVRLVAEKWLWLGRYVGILLLFGFVYLMVLRPLRDKLLKTFELSGDRQPALAAGAGADGRALSPQETALLSQAQLQEDLQLTNSDVERVIKLKKHLTEKVKRDPAQASAVLRQWMHEGESHS